MIEALIGLGALAVVVGLGFGLARFAELAARRDFSAADRALTRQEILAHLRAHGPATASAIAIALDRSITDMRTHLAVLAAQGLVVTWQVADPTNAGGFRRLYGCRPQETGLGDGRAR